VTLAAVVRARPVKAPLAGPVLGGLLVVVGLGWAYAFVTYAILLLVNGPVT
jgi:hypothetical protein